MKLIDKFIVSDRNANPYYVRVWKDENGSTRVFKNSVSSGCSEPNSNFIVGKTYIFSKTKFQFK